MILAKQGVLCWLLESVGSQGMLDALLRLPGVGGHSLSSSYLGMFVVFVYIWLPYMILPPMRFNKKAWNHPSRAARIAAYLGLAFMHLPVVVILLCAFTTADRIYEFPPPGLTLHWFNAASHNCVAY